MIYKYKGIDAKGVKLKEKLEANSLGEAKQKLKAKGVLYTSISQENPSFLSNVNFSKKYKISPKELSHLSREIAMYIRSGVTVVATLKIIESHYDNNKKMRLFLTTLSTLIDEGKDFFSALDEQSIVVLPEFFKHSVKVSEHGGSLDEVLMELSRFLKEQDKITKEIKSAFAYPSFMIVISLLLIAFMLSYVVPQITGIFESMDQELPTPTIVVIAMGDFFNEYFTWMLAFSALFVVFFKFMMQKNYAFKHTVHKMLLKLPLFGEIIQKSELARFSYIAALLARSGVPFVQTVNLSANILSNVVIKELFVNASKEVVEGKHLSKALHNSSTKIDHAFIQSIALGEDTSELENVLTNVSELYFEENRDKISTLLTLLEPSLMLFVGASIGFIVAAMLLPIFSMSIQ